uniref:Uncharacterized protein n=1 Tax=Arundo donax TaxID=35708 RepID=A0A0A9ESC7_ARUDO
MLPKLLHFVLLGLLAQLLRCFLVLSTN